MDPRALKSELLAMAAEDQRVREELIREGTLFQGYHPRMRDVHERNAARLLAIVKQHGWPGYTLVGEKAAEAAWLVLQHASGNPALQRRCLEMLRDAVIAAEAQPAQVAMLEDRIRCNEGKGQYYGTQFDWDEAGLLSPLPLEDGANVDIRRREIGLPPLEDDILDRRAQAVREGEQAPQDRTARLQEKEAWLRATGWRK